MKIGNAQNFMEKQMSKVEQRKEEEKKIKKGIYQMQVMLDSQSMETLMKECDKAKGKIQVRNRKKVKRQTHRRKWKRCFQRQGKLLR